ncbi:hypothetical protein RvY_03936 [Ramazzottius varieornatus]|uniref:Uncharacterized protein n=1 Tax=Ramazzottius varieornatus TaxID=947166 RepID=A0A1D1UPU9_RAMVA|nr:hypothetical protein RvY_03936 [Ramazzottius varieornatus]
MERLLMLPCSVRSLGTYSSADVLCTRLYTWITSDMWQKAQQSKDLKTWTVGNKPTKMIVMEINDQ